MTQLPIQIAGIGHYLPQQQISSSDLATRLELPHDWIAAKTGVHTRHYANLAAGETTVGMGAAAARMALTHANIHVDQLDVIVAAATGAEQLIPCTAVLLQRALGAPEGQSVCFDVNATCMSFLVALHLVAAQVATGVYQTALIVTSEIASTSLNPREPESAALFGDAAAAVVVRRTPSGSSSALCHTRLATYSSGSAYIVGLGGGTRHHPNDPTTTPEMNMFHMEGPRAYLQVFRTLPPFLDTFFAEVGWRREEIAAVVPHQASQHGLDLLTQRLGFRAEQVVANLATRGNTVAASIPLALSEAVHAGRIRRGDRLALIGAGAGLTLGAMALVY